MYEELRGECELCGERYDTASSRPSISEVAEFWDPSRGEGNEGVIAHGECGFSAGLEMA